MASEWCAILTRKGYVERIHECWRGQGMSAATHDVLIHHDAALRARVAELEAGQKAMDRALAAVLGSDMKLVMDRCHVPPCARAARRGKKRKEARRGK